METLREHLRRLDGRGYKAYKTIAGSYDYPGCELVVDHVQGDPFADPSRIRALLPATTALLPQWALASEAHRAATADFLNRRLHRALSEATSRKGSGKSGELRVLKPGQEVLRRSSLWVDEQGGVEARFRVGLPARGRRIRGEAAAQILTTAVPEALRNALTKRFFDEESLRLHVATVENARALRGQLLSRGLVAFVADGARLPRRSGIDDRPLATEETVPFRSPASLRVELRLPEGGMASGMGISAGVALIVGGGFHGKSTLLRAIERGVYDHVPGDGRERVVTVADAVKVRAEDGRSVAGTDISNFIGDLPDRQDTRNFTTQNASGSTSQAAAIIEALEVGANCLLLDEDTSATNFMIRDARMQALIAADREPITPFIDRARQLADRRGTSTILVVGGSGDYFDVADTVIAMHDYVPEDVTAGARKVVRTFPTLRQPEGGDWREIAPRVPLLGSLDPSRGRRKVSVQTRSAERIRWGDEEVELSAVEQIVEAAQTRAMGLAIAWARGSAINGERTVAEALRAIMAVLQDEGLDAFQRELTGELATFRIHELAAFLARLRALETRPVDPR